MPLTIEWDGGVCIEYGSTRLVFDPRKRSHALSRVFVTHAHLDHSKGFSFRDSEKISTKETKEIISAYGKEINHWKPLQVGDRVEIDGLEVVSHNAGHVLGSALYEVITQEGSVVYTGDLQFIDTFTMKGSEPVSCDVLIIDSTFGSRNFRFPNRETVTEAMIRWAQATIRNGKIPTFKADSLGNAQEVTMAFNMYSKLPVTVHWRVAQINEIYNSNGRHLEFLDARSEEAFEITSTGACIFITSKNVNLANHPEMEPALVSGWALWTKKTAFPLSDHSDFAQLMDFVEACKPRTVLTCFGGRRNYIFADEVKRQLGIEARPLDLIPTKFVL